MLRQCAARIDAFRIERTLRQSAQCRTAAYVGDLEPYAFFGPDAHCGDIASRPNREILKNRDRDQSGEHTRRAVEVAAVRYAIEVGTHKNARRSPIAPRDGDIGIGSSVAANLESRALAMFQQDAMPPVFALAIGVPGYARLCAISLGKTREERFHHAALRRDGRLDDLRVRFCHAVRTE